MSGESKKKSNKVHNEFHVSARHPIYRDIELKFDLRDLKTKASGKRDEKVEDERRLSNGTKMHIIIHTHTHTHTQTKNRVSTHTPETIQETRTNQTIGILDGDFGVVDAHRRVFEAFGTGSQR